MSAILNVILLFPNQADPRTKDWFLVGCPWTVIIFMYLYVKLVTEWGPKWMENRPPFKMHRVIQLYDIFQILANARIFYKAAKVWSHYNWQCEPIDFSLDPKAMEIAEIVHSYYMLKYLDLVETVLFVLRKKQSQVSFVHIFHHLTMILAGWLACRFCAGGHGTFIGLVNTLIHVIMYTHYFVTTLKIWKPWWKKHLTQLQILQFLLILYHFLQLFWVKDCGYSVYWNFFSIPFTLTMIGLFVNFYYQTYVKKSE